MSLKCGIVGLRSVGKPTRFNALVVLKTIAKN